jgi:cytoskeletal protein RodZ
MLNSGTCTIQATKAGNGNWAAAKPVSLSFNVHHQAQTVTFAVIPTQSLSADAGSLTLSATASSGLAVTFTSSTPTVCTDSGNTATLLTTGTCSILATQAGNCVYGSIAEPRSFTIVP